MKPLLIGCALLFLSFTQEKIQVLYKSIDPTSISKHLAFYQLFPESPEGKKALEDAWKLLSKQCRALPMTYVPESAIDSIVTLVTKAEGVKTLSLNQEDLFAIQHLAESLPNRKLKGHFAQSEEEVLKLAPEDVDLSRGLLLAQLEEDKELKEKLAAYEALIDLMALQIAARFPSKPTPQQKIREINRFIFQEMGYRFPPHSVYAKDIDLYTYLPSVIDSRRGVCLGVSILYLALSQRLDLPLEAITPPGHIYVRYRSPEGIRNIETTARGIHVDCEEYLGIETTELPLRNMKEVIGLAYYNEASVHWQNENYEKALLCYHKAEKYLPQDPLLMELMGFNYLFIGELEKGKSLIEKAHENGIPCDQIAQGSVGEDYLLGKIDAEGIRTIFLHVDENRDSLLNKKVKLQKLLQTWPNFRAGYFHLAIVFLQLHRMGDALSTLQQYAAIEPDDPSAHYLLSELSAERFHYPNAWKYLKQAKQLLANRKKLPKALKEFEHALSTHSPPPN